MRSVSVILAVALLEATFRYLGSIAMALVDRYSY